jgi:SP family facilitated glucose transporter-like MFS transporter 8
MGVVLMFVQQWSGVNAVLFNINTLTTKAGTVGFAGAQVFCTLVASLVMERQGRRFFLALSAIGMSVSCVAFGYVLQQHLSSTLSMICALCYVAFFSFGLGPMPWVVCTELYPARVRTMAVSLSTVVNWTCGFVITLTFSMLSNALGKGGVMYLYGTICSTSIL